MSASFVPSLLPSISNNLWFQIEEGTTVDEESALAKEELEYLEKMEKALGKGQEIAPIGQSKDKHNQDLDDYEEVDEEESPEELEDDTDEYEPPSPEYYSIAEEADMMAPTGVVNEEGNADAW